MLRRIRPCLPLEVEQKSHLCLVVLDPPPASSVLLAHGLVGLVIRDLVPGLVVPVVLVLAFVALLFVDPGPSSPLVPVKIDENEREKKEVSIVVIKKQQIIEHTWRRRRRTPSSAAVAALRSARERQKERDTEREREREIQVSVVVTD